MKILQLPGWLRPKGFSNGIAVLGEMVFITGIVGWNSQGQFETHDFVGQVRQQT